MVTFHKPCLFKTFHSSALSVTRATGNKLNISMLNPFNKRINPLIIVANIGKNNTKSKKYKKFGLMNI